MHTTDRIVVTTTRGLFDTEPTNPGCDNTVLQRVALQPGGPGTERGHSVPHTA